MRKNQIFATIVIALVLVVGASTVKADDGTNDNLLDRIMMAFMQIKLSETPQITPDSMSNSLGVSSKLPVENYLPVIRYNEGYYSAYDIETAGAIISGGAMSVTGETVVAGFTEGDSALDMATSTGTTTLTQAQLLDSYLLDITVNTGATAAIVMPATSTMTTLIPNAGNHREWLIHNATSSTMAMTITKGDGIDLIAVGTDADVIDATEFSILQCTRQTNTDVVCRLSEDVHVD